MLSPAAYYQDFFALLWALHSSKFIVESLLIAYTLSAWLSQNYTIKDHVLIITGGVWSRYESTYQLEQLATAGSQQGRLGRMFRFGTVTLEFTTPKVRQTVELDDIWQPQILARSISAM
jgi:uncharacterized membrane protein YdbT with pleckstrin-like domain